MKPLEFKIEENEKGYYDIMFFYEDGNCITTTIIDLPTGLELGKHYSIADIYGYQVKDDREGL